MRVAICISALPRGFKRAYPSMKKFFIEPLNADVFISTYDRIDATYTGRLFATNDDGTLEEYKDLYKPLLFEAVPHGENTLNDIFPYPEELSKLRSTASVLCSTLSIKLIY